MKKLIIILSLLLLASCCRNSLPVRSEKVDSVRIERVVEVVEQLRDTTIYVSVPVEIKEVIAQDSSYLETSFAESKAVIRKDGSLLHTLHNKPQEKPVTVQVKDKDTKETDITEAVKIEVKEVAVKMPLSNFRKFLLWSGVVFWLAAIAYVAIKIYVKFGKP